jgi:hypothetical protein
MEDAKHELEVRQVHIEGDEAHPVKDPDGVQFRDEAIEKRLRRKFDFRVLPLGTIIYLFAYIDRTNFGNARILGLTQDAQMLGMRYNVALTLFYVSYVIFEMSVY